MSENSGPRLANASSALQSGRRCALARSTSSRAAAILRAGKTARIHARARSQAVRPEAVGNSPERRHRRERPIRIWASIQRGELEESRLTLPRFAFATPVYGTAPPLPGPQGPRSVELRPAATGDASGGRLQLHVLIRAYSAHSQGCFGCGAGADPGLRDISRDLQGETRGVPPARASASADARSRLQLAFACGRKSLHHAHLAHRHEVAGRRVGVRTGDQEDCRRR